MLAWHNNTKEGGREGGEAARSLDRALRDVIKRNEGRKATNANDDDADDDDAHEQGRKERRAGGLGSLAHSLKEEGRKGAASRPRPGAPSLTPSPATAAAAATYRCCLNAATQVE